MGPLAEVYGCSPLIAQLPADLVGLVGVSPGEWVIDIGTGTGLALIAAAPSGAFTNPMIGVDRSRAMLNVAARRLAEAAVGASQGA